jgi:hypothetical protein
MLAVAVLCIAVMLMIWSADPHCVVVSTLDGRHYTVCSRYGNRITAANKLAEINIMFVRIIKELKINHMDSGWGEGISYLASNYNPDVLGEHAPISITNTSYVTNKGQKIRMCLRKKHNRRIFHEMNIVKFVAIHELCHMMTYSMGHADDFWDAFKYVLHVAEGMGEIVIVDYESRPTRYCGMVVDHSPYFD